MAVESLQLQVQRETRSTGTMTWTSRRLAVASGLDGDSISAIYVSKEQYAQGRLALYDGSHLHFVQG